MAPNIPDRWKDYKPIGRKVEGTRFIAFKVPLREHISYSVDSDTRLDGTILLKSIPNLGFIIDLTNTKRYYDPDFFIRMGVEYEKLMIPGHETPHKSLVAKFVGLVKKFLDKNPHNDKLIGVHCTHGVNRTGYLICNYMISEMTIDPKEAIRRFAHARGHKIERNNYIDALLAHNDLKTNKETSLNNNSNWRERNQTTPNSKSPERFRGGHWRIARDRHHRRSISKSPESFGRRDNRVSSNRYRKRSLSKSPEIFRGRDSRVSRGRYQRRSRSKSPESFRRDRYRSRSRISRTKSPKTYRSDRYANNRRSPNSISTSRPSHNPGTNDKYHYQIKNRESENANNSYRHLPENVPNQRPALRTDYYSSRRLPSRQRSPGSYKRNTNY